MTDGDRETDDCGFLGGRLTLRQFRRGHRAGTDAVLLAAATRIGPGEHFLDVGAGVGAAALAVLARVADCTATLVERDASTAELAAFNLAANGFAARGRVVQADIFDDEAISTVREAGADVVICNPPYFEPGRVRAASDLRRRASHVLERPLTDWCRRLLACLRPKGRLVLIHRPDAVPRLLASLDGRAGAAVLRPVHARADREAVRIILTATVGSRAALSLAPPLILHGDRTFLPFAQNIHDGERALV